MIPYYVVSAATLLRRFRPFSAVLRLSRGRGDEVIRIKGPGVEFRVRDFMDVWTLKETFVDNDYEKYGFKMEPGWTVVDIGAAMGDFAIHAARDYGASKVLAVEPAPTAIPILRENIERNGAKGIVVVDKAISNSAEELWLDTSGDFVSMGTTSTQGESGTRVKVDVLTLRGLFEAYDVERCDLLKVDCEGGEYDILLGATDADLERVQRVVLEFHEGRHPDHGTRKDLAERLRSARFEPETFESKVHPNLGYIRASR